MKKILILASILLSVSTAGAFAAVITEPVPAPAAPTQNATPTLAKHKHKKHAKHHKKAKSEKPETK